MRSVSWLDRASVRGLLLFVSPPFHGRRTGWLLSLGLVALISVADYFAGVDLSFSLFYLIPVALAAGWLGARAGVIVASVATVLRTSGDIASVYPNRLPAYVWWNLGAPFLIFVFVTWLVNSLVKAHRALEGRVAARTSELADSVAERRRLELEVIEVGARERAAIGRELHDELGQHLVATAMAAKVLAHQLGTTKGAQEAQSIVRWIEDAIAKTRKLARGLLLAQVEADRLPGELEDLAAASSKGGVRCRFQHQGSAVAASAPACAQLFRIAQEALGNALRHGGASAIDITLAVDEQATCLIVADDGCGFDQNDASPGMGLRIMEHRAQMISGSLAVLSQPGQGTRVVCRLPIALSRP
jgi:signal transduction histidine kinase